MDSTRAEEIFVQADWLAQHLEDPGVRIVDLRWRPSFERGHGVVEDRREDYLASHIPGAVFLGSASDLNIPSARDTSIYLVASADQFASTMGRVGIGPHTHVVVYDDAPLYMAAARLYWMLLYYGHANVRILAGGLRQWRSEGRPLTDQISQVHQDTFTPNVQPALRATKETMQRSLGDPSIALIDCRSIDHYKGEPQPWGTRDGRIPGAASLPWLTLGLDSEKAASNEARMKALSSDQPIHFLPTDDLRGLFAQAGVKQGKRAVTYCGAGYAACISLVALKLIGFDNAAVYDGSIAEWTRDPTLPMEMDP